MVKKHIKDILILLVLVAIIAVIVVFAVDIKSVDDYYSPDNKEDIGSDNETDNTDNGNGMVYLSIDCKTILNNFGKLDKGLAEFVPSDGVILSKSEFPYKSGDTAFSILERATRLNKIALDYSGSSVYVKGINNLYEFCCGELSGWIFIVNGVQVNKSCDKVALQPNDIVEWRFSCDLGRDLV